MSAIKLHLDDEEYAPVIRLADELHVKPEDVVYAALNRLMNRSAEEEIRADVRETSAWRAGNLPRWGDHGRTVQIYEGQHDLEPEER